jgi:hypothetical protein
LALVVVFGHAGMPISTIGALAAVEAFYMLSGAFMAAAYGRHYSHLNRGASSFG